MKNRQYGATLFSLFFLATCCVCACVFMFGLHFSNSSNFIFFIIKKKKKMYHLLCVRRFFNSQNKYQSSLIFLCCFCLFDCCLSFSLVTNSVQLLTGNIYYFNNVPSSIHCTMYGFVCVF